MVQEICKLPADVVVASTGQRAHRACQRVISDMICSDVVDVNLVDAVIRLECEEVLLGDLLGTGNFCHVAQVHRLDFKPVKTTTTTQLQQRQKMQTESSKGKYAIKFLRNDLNPNQFCQGAAELVLEMLLLSSLSHSNIISMAGVSKEGPAGFESGNGFFILIDRLGTTLDQQIPIWRDLERRHQCDALVRQSMFVQRLAVTADIASALSYLHSKSILYRGIDPTNFAFNDRGRIVLFDMGLARILDQSRLAGDGVNYELSGNKGNMQYMAPEVGTCRPYGLHADVYGIAVLLWQVCALEPFPFPGVKSIDHFRERIVLKKERPSMIRSWPDTLKYLIRSSWADDPSARPPMKHFHRNLQLEIEDIQATLPRKMSRDLLKAASDPTVTRTQSQVSHSKAQQQHAQVSPKRSPQQSPAATGAALQHGTVMARNSWSPPAPSTPPKNAIARRPRRATFHENDTGKVVDSILQAQTLLGSSQSSEEASRSSIVERYMHQNAQYQTLEDKLRVVNAAFDVMGTQDSTTNSCSKSPSSSLASSVEDRCSSVSDPPQYPTMIRRSSSLIMRSTPTTSTTTTTTTSSTNQLPKSWIHETNPVLREIRAKKWKLAHEAEQKANAIVAAKGGMMRVAGTDNQAPSQRQSRSPRVVDRDRSDVRHRNGGSSAVKSAQEHNAGKNDLDSGMHETAMRFKGSPVRASSLTAMDAIRNRVLMFDSNALQQRQDNVAHSSGMPCQDFGNKTKR